MCDDSVKYQQFCKIMDQEGITIGTIIRSIDGIMCSVFAWQSTKKKCKFEGFLTFDELVNDVIINFS